jgi:hypothetical protein
MSEQTKAEYDAGCEIEDIEQAAEGLAAVADALNDMINGEREIELMGSQHVDPLMTAHGVLLGIADKLKSKQ